MSLLDEWNKVKRNEGTAEGKKWALTKGSPKDPKPYISSGGTSRPPDAEMAAMVQRNTLPANSQPTFASKQASDEADRSRNEAVWSRPPAGPSLMEQLIDRINEQYEPVMPPPQDPNAPNPNDAIMERMRAELDNALASRMGVIGNARNQAQQGYSTSDSNLAAMFGANANNIATQGSQRFSDITQNLKTGLTGTRDESLNRLAADRNESMNQRAEMLQRLGIEEAGGQVDPGTATMNDAMTGITNRSNMALQGADQQGATNQGFNQSVVNSINQQGTERRAALLQQLQSIQNELGMAEAEAQDQNAQGKSQLELQRMQAEAEQQGQQQSSYEDMNKFGYQQFRDNRDLAFDMYKTLLGQQNLENKPGPEAPPTRGYASLGEGLVNQLGVPEEQASQYMAALSQVLSSEYMTGVHPDDGYSRSDIINRKLSDMNIPGPVASYLATNYSNL